MQVNPNLKFLRDNYLKTRIFVLQGSTRSGKTYSVVQFLIELCYTYQNAGMVITIARATYPSLRGSVMRDFFQILSDFNGYSERNHNKTESTYQLMGNMIEFISLDQPQKIRGRKRDIVL
jgi:phage terminase large subunit